MGLLESTAMNDLFLRAARGEDTRHAPVWMMRQAGRYLPEYRALKEKYSFWEMARTPELASEVTLQPIQRLGVDAAILFQDIMTPLPPMGIAISFQPGPVIEAPIRSQAQVAALRVPEKEEIAPYVAEAIGMIRSACSVPLIGFGGAPLTLATYLIEGSGSKDYALFRQFLRQEPQAAHELLEKLTEVSIRYLAMQVEAGAQAIQLFDSWAGLHDAAMYRSFAQPYNARVLESLAKFDVPRIYLAVGSSHLYPDINTLPCEVVSVDWRLPLSSVRQQLPSKILQGNLDPAILLADKATITQASQQVLRQGLGAAHIFNLGHGIMRQTDPDHALHMIETVQQFDRHEV